MIFDPKRHETKRFSRYRATGHALWAGRDDQRHAQLGERARVLRAAQDDDPDRWPGDPGAGRHVQVHPEPSGSRHHAARLAREGGPIDLDLLSGLDSADE